MIVFPDYVSIERKKVKFACVRVYPDGKVKITIPQRMTLHRTKQIYLEKCRWINRKRVHLLTSAVDKFNIEPSEVLLFGKGYKFEFNSNSTQHINDKSQYIVSNYNLQDASQLLEWYRLTAKNYLPDRTEKLADKCSIVFNKVTVRAQKTRWGSCSANGNISLNWKLIKMPIWVGDYVIIHELAHTKVMNHSSSFWRQVELLLPDYQKARQWIKEYGVFL